MIAWENGRHELGGCRRRERAGTDPHGEAHPINIALCTIAQRRPRFHTVQDVWQLVLHMWGEASFLSAVL